MNALVKVSYILMMNGKRELSIILMSRLKDRILSPLIKKNANIPKSLQIYLQNKGKKKQFKYKSKIAIILLKIVLKRSKIKRYICLNMRMETTKSIVLK